jgi:hypothetical protein
MGFMLRRFMAFGIALIWCGFGLGAILQVFWALRAVVFLGSVARIMPTAAVGWRTGLFVSVGSLELR